MADWTYDFSPGTDNNDAVRFLVGQTSTADEVLIYDPEITFALNRHGSVDFAAAEIARAMASRYASLASAESVGDLRIQYMDRAKGLRETASSLQQGGLFQGVSPFVGGISVGQKDSEESDTDRVDPQFRIGMHDNPSLNPSTST